MNQYFKLLDLRYVLALTFLLSFSDNYGQIAVESSDNKVGIGHLTPLYDVHVKADVFNVESKSGANKLFLNGAGNLGLGTNTPGAKFDMFSYGNTFAKMTSAFSGGLCGFQIDNSGANSQGRIFFTLGGVTSGGIFYNHKNGGASQDMAFDVAGTLPELVIKGNGNIGIGTLTPNARLEVNGSVRITGLLTDNNATQLGIDPDGDLVKINSSALKVNIEQERKLEQLQIQLTDQKILIENLWKENDELKGQIISNDAFKKIQESQNNFKLELAETRQMYDDLVTKIELLFQCVNCASSFGPIRQINESSEPMFNLYPNPAQGALTISSSQNIDVGYHLIISDNFGRKILAQSLQENITTIDISELASGLYNVSFLDDNEIIEYAPLMIVN